MSEINCSTCRWCKEDRCEIRYQTAGPKIQECYDPDLPVVTDAIYELTSLRYKATPQISRGAAILLDLFSGVSEDMIKQKYADTYGQAGYDNSGYARVCEAALCSLDDTEASKAFRMWYQAYCFRRDKKILKQAMSYGRSRSFKRLTLSVVEGKCIFLDREPYTVIHQPEYGQDHLLITPSKPTEKTVWGMKDNSMERSVISEKLDAYVSTRPELKQVLKKKPRLFYMNEYENYKDLIPEWEQPYWVACPVARTNIFVMAVQGKRVLPMCCYSADVYLRPVFEISTGKEVWENVE